MFGFTKMAPTIYRAANCVIALSLALSLATAPVFAQTAALLPNAKQTFVDANGKPLSGGKVYFYVPTTLTPKTTWQDQNEAVANANPVVLDSAGRAKIFGQGNYDQKVIDSLGNVQWLSFTSAIGSAPVSGATGTDTAPVGTILPWGGSNLNLPTNWQLAYGQAVNRADFPDLLAAETITTVGALCSSGSPNIGGFADTSQVPVGAKIEASCLSVGVTVLSIVNATTVQASSNANSTTTTTARVFLWGNGDGTLTFNVPDMRGRVVAGPDSMGGTAASRLTSTYYGSSAATPGIAGGAQSHTLLATELPVSGYSSVVTDPGHFHTNVLFQGGAGAAAWGGGTGSNTTANTGTSTTGITVATTVPGGGNAHAIVQPSLTINYIVKVKANTTGAGGVVTIGGMFGDILCGANIICAGGTISASGTIAVSLSNNHIFVGNGSSVATDVAMSGDASIVSGGAITVSRTGGVLFAPSATTDTTNAANITAGILPVGRLTNDSTIWRTATTTDSILSTDCNKTVYEGTGSSGLYVVTLPSIAGFPTGCRVTVVNGDTSRGKTLTGFPSDIYCILYPAQGVTVQIINGAWASVNNPGRYQPTGDIAFHSDSVNGHDTCASDGLATGAAAFQTIPYAYRTWQQHFNGTGTSGQKVTVTIEDATLTITTDIAILGPPAPGYISTVNNKPFKILGKGPGSTTVQSTTNGANLFQLQGSAEAQFDQMTLKATGTGSACILVNGSQVFISTVSTGSVNFDKCTNAGVDAAGSSSVAIVGPHGILSTATFNNFEIVESGAWGFVSGQLTIAGSPTWTTAFVNADITSRWDLSGFGFSGSAGAASPKFNATLNGVIFTNGLTCTALPGSTAGATSTGGQCL